MEEERKKLE